ncbi:MAG: MmcQ/YjbR family DNA-binding protein [Oleiphilaceae bacterium]|nr:MmcQ/YjbR family DNA-binding protein [Oleiphilaceae bacterium]
MNHAETRQYLLNKPATIEDYPFGPDIMVPKVKGKMFATLAWRGDTANINLKCNPDQIPGLIDTFEGIHPGYHMNKKHWVTVDLDGSVPAQQVQQLIDQSYALVVKGLQVKIRKALELEWGMAALYGVQTTSRAP